MFAWVPRYSAEVLRDTPLLYLRLNDPSGTTATDISGNGRNGTYQNGPSLAQSGTPITVDPNAKVITLTAASSHFVSVAYQAFAAGSQRTFEMWAKMTTARANNFFIGGGGAGLVSCTNTNNGDGPPYHMNWRVNAGTGAMQWTYAWPDATSFHHLALTWDDTAKGAEMFIDGASIGTKTSANAYAETAIDFYASGTSSYFTGSLAEVAVYSGILSSTRIAAHFSAATTKFKQQMENTSRLVGVRRAANY